MRSRVRSASSVEKYKAQFPNIKLVSVEETFGGWERVTAEHFAADGILDQLLAAKN